MNISSLITFPCAHILWINKWLMMSHPFNQEFIWRKEKVFVNAWAEAVSDIILHNYIVCWFIFHISLDGASPELIKTSIFVVYLNSNFASEILLWLDIPMHHFPRAFVRKRKESCKVWDLGFSRLYWSPFPLLVISGSSSLMCSWEGVKGLWWVNALTLGASLRADEIELTSEAQGFPA